MLFIVFAPKLGITEHQKRPHSALIVKKLFQHAINCFMNTGCVRCVENHKNITSLKKIEPLLGEKPQPSCFNCSELYRASLKACKIFPLKNKGKPTQISQEIYPILKFLNRPSLKIKSPKLLTLTCRPRGLI